MGFFGTADFEIKRHIEGHPGLKRSLSMSVHCFCKKIKKRSGVLDEGNGRGWGIMMWFEDGAFVWIKWLGAGLVEKYL